jgi:hypothetical protein
VGVWRHLSSMAQARSFIFKFRYIDDVLSLNMSEVGDLGSRASSFAADLYQGNPDGIQKLWNIVSTDRCILHMQVLLECCYIYMESSQWENLNQVFCRKVSFLTAPHCQFRDVGQVMKQSQLTTDMPHLS